MKNKDWINIYDKSNPPGFVAICESGRPDLLTYWYTSKEEAEVDTANFKARTGNKCYCIVEVKKYE